MIHLLIAAHGTPGGAPSAEPANAHADRIRHQRTFANVATAFLRQEPAFPDAIHAWLRTAVAASSELVIVPLFMAEGWYSRTVLPRELRDAIAGTAPGHARLRLALPVGVHRSMPALVARAVQRTTGNSAHVVLIGHGTPRDARSRATVEHVAAALRRAAAFASIDVAFLDEPPHLAPVLERLLSGPLAVSKDVVVVPFFAGDGMHVREHIAATVADVNAGTGTRITCTPAIGVMPEVAGVIVRLARAASRRMEWALSS